MPCCPDSSRGQLSASQSGGCLLPASECRMHPGAWGGWGPTPPMGDIDGQKGVIRTHSDLALAAAGAAACGEAERLPSPSRIDLFRGVRSGPDHIPAPCAQTSIAAHQAMTFCGPPHYQRPCCPSSPLLLSAHNASHSEQPPIPSEARAAALRRPRQAHRR